MCGITRLERDKEPVAPARATGTSLARRWRGGRGTGPRHPPGPRAASIPPLPARLDLEKTVFFMPPGRRVSRASEGRDSVLVSAPGCFRIITLHRAPIASQSKHAPAARGRRRVKAIENCAICAVHA